MRGLVSVFGSALILTLAFSIGSGQGGADPPRVRRHLQAAGCSVVLSPSSRNHGAGAETGTVTVTAAAGCAWVATSSAAWLSITSGSNGTGGGTVGYSVAANGATSSRSATIMLQGQVFTVNQAGVACTYALEPTSRHHGPGAETGTVSVTAPPGCAWTATSNDAWISVTGASDGTGNGTVTYGVAANTGTGRSGTLTIAAQVFTVSQAAEELTVYLGPNNTVPLVLVRIPAGTFTMGSPESERGRGVDEGPQHQVTLTRDYYLGKTEVTQRQWVAVMGTNPDLGSPYGVGDTYPVYNVSWTQVCGGATGDACYGLSFIGKVNSLLGTTKFRLPTEAEWERAARGGTQTPFSFGDDPSCSITDCSPCNLFAQYMWWCGNAAAMTHPVGQKLANPFGLYDMHGNVWEWAADYMGSYPADPVVDPKGPPWNPVHGRAVRGGGHYSEWSYPRLCRSAQRALDSGGDPGIGLRLARTP